MAALSPPSPALCSGSVTERVYAPGFPIPI